MKINEVIEQLREIEKMHGDLPVKIGRFEVTKVDYRSDPEPWEDQKLALCRVVISS